VRQRRAHRAPIDARAKLHKRLVQQHGVKLLEKRVRVIVDRQKVGQRLLDADDLVLHGGRGAFERVGGASRVERLAANVGLALQAPRFELVLLARLGEAIANGKERVDALVVAGDKRLFLFRRAGFVVVVGRDLATAESGV